MPDAATPSAVPPARGRTRRRCRTTPRATSRGRACRGRTACRASVTTRRAHGDARPGRCARNSSGLSWRRVGAGSPLERHGTQPIALQPHQRRRRELMRHGHDGDDRIGAGGGQQIDRARRCARRAGTATSAAAARGRRAGSARAARARRRGRSAHPASASRRRRAARAAGTAPRRRAVARRPRSPRRRC